MKLVYFPIVLLFVAACSASTSDTKSSKGPTLTFDGYNLKIDYGAQTKDFVVAGDITYAEFLELDGSSAGEELVVATYLDMGHMNPPAMMVQVYKNNLEEIKQPSDLYKAELYSHGANYDFCESVNEPCYSRISRINASEDCPNGGLMIVTYGGDGLEVDENIEVKEVICASGGKLTKADTKELMVKGASSSKFPMIAPDLLASETKPYNIRSYFKFYIGESEKATTILENDKKEFPSGQGIQEFVEVLDLRGGYMRVKTPVMDGLNYTEYVYWNLSDGSKLFAANKVSMEPFTGETYTDFFEFRVFKDDQWAEANIGALSDFMSNNYKLSAQELVTTPLAKQILASAAKDKAESFLLKLPQKGKDLELTLNTLEGTEDGDIWIEESKVVLQFNDGQFEYRPE